MPWCFTHKATFRKGGNYSKSTLSKNFKKKRKTSEAIGKYYLTSFKVNKFNDVYIYISFYAFCQWKFIDFNSSPSFLAFLKSPFHGLSNSIWLNHSSWILIFRHLSTWYQFSDRTKSGWGRSDFLWLVWVKFSQSLL